MAVNVHRHFDEMEADRKGLEMICLNLVLFSNEMNETMRN